MEPTTKENALKKIESILGPVVIKDHDELVNGINLHVRKIRQNLTGVSFQIPNFVTDNLIGSVLPKGKKGERTYPISIAWDKKTKGVMRVFISCENTDVDIDTLEARAKLVGQTYVLFKAKSGERIRGKGIRDGGFEISQEKFAELKTAMEDYFDVMTHDIPAEGSNSDPYGGSAKPAQQQS